MPTNKNIPKKYRDALEYIISIHGGQKIELDYETDFQLLIAVLLSAQTTDKQVNRVTPPFFAKVREAKDLENMELEEVEEYLKYINFFRNKSRFVKETGKIVAEKYDGKIPNSLELLTALPWVGIKTAKVVTAVLYDAPYVAVDTHVHRVLNRLGLVATTSPLETDKILEKILPTDLKKRSHHPLVLFGRYFCTAKKPKCEECKISEHCDFWKNFFKEKVAKAKKSIKNKNPA